MFCFAATSEYDFYFTSLDKNSPTFNKVRQTKSPFATHVDIESSSSSFINKERKKERERDTLVPESHSLLLQYQACFVFGFFSR